MGRGTIFALFLTILQLNAICVYGTWLGRYRNIVPNIENRPGFTSVVTRRFKLAAFNNAGKSVIGKHSLNHVYSWDNILHDISHYLKISYDYARTYRQNNGFIQANLFLNRLFEIDNQAIVRRGYYHLNGETIPNPANIMHSDYLVYGLYKNNPHNNDHNLGDGPNGLNHQYRNDVLAKLELLDFVDEDNNYVKKQKNARLIRDILKIANSAPANLRYGHSGTNGSIQEKMDPMGDNNGRRTNQEQVWFDMITYKPNVYQYNQNGFLISNSGLYIYSSYYYYSKIYENQKLNHQPYNNLNGNPIVMSSTGKFQHRTWDKNSGVLKDRLFIDAL